MLKIQTYLAGERLGWEGWGGLLSLGPQCNSSNVLSPARRGITMRGNHPGEGKREQQPEKAPPAPAVRPKWSSPGWEHPQRHSWLGGSCGSAGVSHSQPLRASSRTSHSTSVPGIGGQISSSRSGMFFLSLECCSVGWQCWQHAGPAQGMCQCWEPLSSPAVPGSAVVALLGSRAVCSCPIST